MCLAIPAQITEMKGNGMAQVSILGTTRDIAVDLTPQAGVGSYVLVHAGFSIEVVDEEYAQETLRLIDEMSELVDGFEIEAGQPRAAEAGAL